MATRTDFLWAATGGAPSIVPGAYVRAHNNDTGVDYYSSATDLNTGAYTITGPPGWYSIYSGTSPTVGGTSTLRSANWEIPLTAGDDAALKSVTTSASSPYAPQTGIRAGSAGTAVDPFDVRAYGAKWDGQKVTDGAMAAASGVITSASALFTAADVGKLLIVTRAGAAVANPTTAITGADGGAGGTTLPVGTYTFAYTWIAYDGETTVGTSTNTYVQAVANHIITLTIPATPAGARFCRIYCTIAPGGAFAGVVMDTANTTFAYTTGITATGASPSAANTTGAPISTTVASYQSATQITATLAATTTCTGATVVWGSDDGTANAAAYTAARVAGRGTVKFPPGISMSSAVFGPINAPSINVEGDGTYSSTIYYTGSGDYLRLQMSPFSNFSWPGRLKGFTVDGTGAAAGACGFHLGDCVNLEMADIRAAYFRGTGSKGFWMDNRTNWTERTIWNKVNAYHNTTNILFDVNGGNVSFDHTMMVEVTLDVEGTGILIKNAAVVGYGVMNFTANIDAASIVIDIQDTSSLGFNNLPMLISATAETAGIATGLKVAAGAYLYGAGCIDFGAGPFTNSDALATFSNIQFSGRFNCPGIHTMSTADGHVSMGNSYLQQGSQSRVVIAAPPTDTALTGLNLLANSVNWYMDHRAASSAPNNALEFSVGGAAYLRIQSNGIVLAKTLQLSRQTPTEAVLVSGVDATAGDVIAVTLTAARLVGAPLNPSTGQRLVFALTQGGAGGFAVTWNATFKKTWADTGNTTGKVSSISFVYDGTSWNQDAGQAPYA